MVKSSYEIRAKKFIHDIFPYLLEEGFIYKRAIRKFNEVKHRKVKQAYGSTRYCLLSSDYVVKIDLTEESCFGTSKDELQNWEEFYSTCGYEDHFAPVSKYTYRDYDFYIMPRIPNVGCFEEEDLKKDIDEDFAEWAFNNIGDIHSEQFGRKNGKFIFVDYAMRP